MFSQSINNAMFSYLEPNLEPIQRRRAGPGHRPCDASGDQVAPPHARHDVLLAEVVGDADVLAEVDALKEEMREGAEQRQRSSRKEACENGIPFQEND